MNNQTATATARTAANAAWNTLYRIRNRVEMYYQDRVERPPTSLDFDRAIDQVEQLAEEANAAATASGDQAAPSTYARSAATALERILALAADQP